MEQKKIRIAIWDNLKFILIFCVVFAHFVDFYTDQSVNMRRIFLVIYSFHMPVFLFISGLFSKGVVYKKNYRRIFEYLIIYLFIKIYLFVIKIFVYGSVSSFSLLNESGLPWYAFTLFVYDLLTICLCKLDKKYLFTFSVILACVVGYDVDISSFLMLSRIIVFYPFFLAGFYCDSNKILEKLKRKKIQILSVIVWIVFILLTFLFVDDIYWIRPLLSGQNPFEALEKFSSYGMVLRAGYYVIVFCLMFSLISLAPKKESIISRWGSRSLQVYMLHYGAIYVILALINKIDWLNEIVSLIGNYWVIPISLIVTILFSMGIWGKILDPFIKPKWIDD